MSHPVLPNTLQQIQVGGRTNDYLKATHLLDDAGSCQGMQRLCDHFLSKYYLPRYTVVVTTVVSEHLPPPPHAYTHYCTTDNEEYMCTCDKAKLYYKTEGDRERYHNYCSTLRYQVAWTGVQVATGQQTRGTIYHN